MDRANKELFRAVQSDDLRAATDALNEGASVDYRINPGAWNNRDAASAFCNALLRGNPEMVKLLLDHGADANGELSNAYDYQTYNIAPLMLALEEGHEAVARLLIERGANPKSEHRFGKEDSGVGEISALGLAARKGLLSIVKLLLSRGASFDYAYTSALPEQSFSSALDMAGTPEVRRYLEEWVARSKGADIGASREDHRM